MHCHRLLTRERKPFLEKEQQPNCTSRKCPCLRYDVGFREILHHPGFAKTTPKTCVSKSDQLQLQDTSAPARRPADGGVRSPLPAWPGTRARFEIRSRWRGAGTASNSPILGPGARIGTRQRSHRRGGGRFRNEAAAVKQFDRSAPAGSLVVGSSAEIGTITVRLKQTRDDLLQNWSMSIMSI